MSMRRLMAKVSSSFRYGLGLHARRWRTLEGGNPRALVLAYHRIGPRRGREEPAGFGVERALPVDVFEGQLRFLLRHFSPLRAAEVADVRPSRPKLSLAVTFDDGYADNLSLAAPVLERLGIPATVYLNSDFVGTDRRFWWEQLGALLRETRAPCIHVEEVVPALRERWPIPDTLAIEGLGERERAHWLLSMALMRTPSQEIDPTLKGLAEALAAPLRREGRDAALLDWEGVRELRKRGFDVGAHGAGHVNLGLASDLEVEREVRTSIEAVAARIDARVESFAYPYGGPEHRSASAMRAVASAGCRVAFTTEIGVVSASCEPLALPRVGLIGGGALACTYRIDQAFQARRHAISK